MPPDDAPLWESLWTTRQPYPSRRGIPTWLVRMAFGEREPDARREVRSLFVAVRRGSRLTPGAPSPYRGVLDHRFRAALFRTDVREVRILRQALRRLEFLIITVNPHGRHSVEKL